MRPRLSVLAVAGMLGVVLLGCAPKPVIVTHPARITTERRERARLPGRTVQWDRDFWHAVTTLNFPVAWTLATTPDERQLADALQSMADGHVVFRDALTVLPLARSTSGVPVIPARVNDRLKGLWLDTGSSITILSSTVAAEYGVTAIGDDTLELLTAIGRLPARPALSPLCG